MIDNGAAVSPSGLPAFIMHCIHTVIIPKLQTRQRSFRGMGERILKSLGKALIRIPIDPLLTLEFEFDIINRDLSIIFGLEHYIAKRCSSNEV